MARTKSLEEITNELEAASAKVAELKKKKKELEIKKREKDKQHRDEVVAYIGESVLSQFKNDWTGIDFDVLKTTLDSSGHQFRIAEIEPTDTDDAYRRFKEIGRNA